MRTLSIEVPEQQHEQIRAMAALSGLSINDYILEKALPRVQPAGPLTEDESMTDLLAFLAPRIAEAERDEFDDTSIEDIIAESHLRHGLSI